MLSRGDSERRKGQRAGILAINKRQGAIDEDERDEDEPDENEPDENEVDQDEDNPASAVTPAPNASIPPGKGGDTGKGKKSLDITNPANGKGKGKGEATADLRSSFSTVVTSERKGPLSALPPVAGGVPAEPVAPTVDSIITLFLPTDTSFPPLAEVTETSLATTILSFVSSEVEPPASKESLASTATFVNSMQDVTESLQMPSVGTSTTSLAAIGSEGPRSTKNMDQSNTGRALISSPAKILLLTLGVIAGAAMLIASIIIILKRRKLKREARSLGPTDGSLEPTIADVSHKVMKTVTITQSRHTRGSSFDGDIDENPQVTSAKQALGIDGRPCANQRGRMISSAMQSFIDKTSRKSNWYKLGP